MTGKSTPGGATAPNSPRVLGLRLRHPRITRIHTDSYGACRPSSFICEICAMVPSIASRPVRCVVDQESRVSRKPSQTLPKSRPAGAGHQRCCRGSLGTRPRRHPGSPPPIRPPVGPEPEPSHPSFTTRGTPPGTAVPPLRRKSSFRHRSSKNFTPCPFNHLPLRTGRAPYTLLYLGIGG